MVATLTLQVSKLQSDTAQSESVARLGRQVGTLRPGWLSMSLRASQCRSPTSAEVLVLAAVRAAGELQLPLGGQAAHVQAYALSSPGLGLAQHMHHERNSETS